jgi:hypothetical protein
MSSRKIAGLSLMMALAGAFIAWNLGADNALPSQAAQMAVSALLALGIFAAWRFLVWNRPRP